MGSSLTDSDMDKRILAALLLLAFCIGSGQSSDETDSETQASIHHEALLASLNLDPQAYIERSAREANRRKRQKTAKRGKKKRVKNGGKKKENASKGKGRKSKSARKGKKAKNGKDKKNKKVKNGKGKKNKKVKKGKGNKNKKVKKG